MKQNFKKVICASLAVMMILSLAACGKTDPGKSESKTEQTQQQAAAETKTEPNKEVKTFKVTTAASWVQQGWEAVKKDIDANSDELGFKIEFDKLPEGDNLLNVTKARFASGDIPEFLGWWNINSLNKELGAYIDKFEDVNGDWTAALDPKTLKMYSYNDKVLGIPFGSSTMMGMLYNKKVFEEAGITEVPGNWTDFLAAMDKIKKIGKIPVYYSGKDAWTLQIMGIVGFLREAKKSDYFKLIEDWDNNKIKTTDMKQFVDSVSKLKELKDKGYVNKNLLSDTYDGAQKALAQGESAVYFMGTWVLSEIEKKYPDKLNDIGGAAIPFDGDDNIVFGTPNGIYMTNTVKDKELGKKFMSYFASVNVQNKYFEAEPGVPVYKGVNSRMPVASKELLDIALAGRGIIDFGGVSKVAYGTLDKYCQDLLVAAKTPEQVAQAMDAERQKDAKAKGLAGW